MIDYIYWKRMSRWLIPFLFYWITPCTAQVHLQWAKKLGSSDQNEVPTAIIPLGQHYLIGGFADHPKTKLRQASLLKINLRGDTLWSQQYPEKKHDSRISHLIATSDGHIAAAGYCISENHQKQILLLKIHSETGELIWKHKLPSTQSLMPQALIETTTSEIWLLYNSEKKDNPSNAVSFIQIGWSKISKEGILLQEKVLDRAHDESLISVCKTTQNEFLLLSNVSDYLNNKDYYRLYTLNSDGSIRQTKDLDWLPYASARLTDLAINEQGNIALIGNSIQPNRKNAPRNTLPKFWLLDEEGQPQKEQMIEIPNHFVHAESLLLDEDGSLFLVGYSIDLEHEREEESNVWIGKIGMYGQLLWWQEYGADYSDRAVAIAPGGRGELIVVGTSFYFNDTQKDTYLLELVEESTDLRRITPKVWALVVGIDQYASSLTLKPLKAAANDAKNFHDFLRSQQGGALPDAQIRLLLNEQATNSNILAAARQLFLEASPYDMILFYFAGHGAQSYFWGYDGKITHSALNSLLTHSPAMKRVCVIDACFSGAWKAKNESVPEVIKSGSAPEVSPPQERYYEALRQSGDGLVLFLSADANEESYESNGQGFFTYFFIEGLKGKADINANQFITVEELYNYVSKNVSDELKQHQLQQHPKLYGVFDKNMPMGVVGE